MRKCLLLLACVPLVLGAGEPLFKVGITTDTHFGRPDVKGIESCEKAWRLFKSQGCGLVVNCGDIANKFLPEWYAEVCQMRKRVFDDPKTAPREIWVYAGHDRIDMPGEKKGLGNYALLKDLLKIPHEAYDHFSIAGFEFLTVPQSVDYSRYEQMLIEACARTPDKPVFVFDHHPGTSTTEGSDLDGDMRRWKLLSKFPQVVHITGHAHGSLFNEQNIHQDTYTSISAACLTYFSGNFTGTYTSTGQNRLVLVMELFSDRAIVRRYSIDDGMEIGADEPWTINWPYDPKRPFYSHENMRKLHPPASFREGASVDVQTKIMNGNRLDIRGMKLLVKFPETGSRFTWYYRIEAFCQQAGKSVRVLQHDVRGEYCKDPKSRKGVVEHALDAAYFNEGEEILLRVTPCDFWGGEGRPLEWRGKAPADVGTLVCGGQVDEKTYRLPDLPVDVDGKLLKVVVDAEFDQPGARPVSLGVKPCDFWWAARVSTPLGHTKLTYIFEIRKAVAGKRYEFSFLGGVKPWTVKFSNLRILVMPDTSSELRAEWVIVNGKKVTDCERREYSDGGAIRYRLPKGKRKVTDEATEWVLPKDARIWFQPAWRGAPAYEVPYTNALVGSLSVGQRMAFPITAKLADGTYRLLTEANVVDYTDGCAAYRGDGRFGIDYYADTNGFDQVGADTTPWRVLLKAKDLQTLATSDIVRRLCPEPPADRAARAREFVRPGRCIWQWLPAGDPVYAEQKDWYDRTKALGFEYYLIDDGWKRWRDGEMDQWVCLKKWIDYGKSIGVESFMWVDSKEMLTAEARRAYLAKVKASGAVGIKIDFIPKPSYAQMKWYEETSAETFALGLMLDYHGSVKPSGREKTWPHEVAREAIRGHEWHITRYRRVLPPEHDCILPFNRSVQGHADYTPMVFEPKELCGFTWARELAQGIIFSAPFLCFGDYPKNYQENPAVELIRSLPSVYDEVRILSGSEIGECIAVAKRKGTDWYLAVENGAKERTLSIALDFLGESGGELIGYGDAPDRPDGYTELKRKVGKTDKLDLTIRPSGGFAARIR